MLRNRWEWLETLRKWRKPDARLLRVRFQGHAAQNSMLGGHRRVPRRSEGCGFDFLVRGANEMVLRVGLDVKEPLLLRGQRIEVGLCSRKFRDGSFVEALETRSGRGDLHRGLTKEEQKTITYLLLVH